MIVNKKSINMDPFKMNRNIIYLICGMCRLKYCRELKMWTAKRDTGEEEEETG